MWKLVSATRVSATFVTLVSLRPPQLASLFFLAEEKKMKLLDTKISYCCPFQQFNRSSFQNSIGLFSETEKITN